MAAGFGAYRQVLGTPEARAFTAAGFAARLPMSMTGLGIVLFISITSGSYGRAGLVTAVATLTTAVAAPAWGRLIDRIGQAPVLIAATIIYNLSTGALITSVLLDAPFAVTLLTAVGVGLGFSSAGAAVRARWSHRLRGTPLLNTAFAWEAVLDEVVFIVGPVLATFLATAVHPALGLAAGGVVGLVGAFVLAAQRGTQPPLASRAERPQPVQPAVGPPAGADRVRLRGPGHAVRRHGGRHHRLRRRGGRPAVRGHHRDGLGQRLADRRGGDRHHHLEGRTGEAVPDRSGAAGALPAAAAVRRSTCCRRPDC